MLHLLNGDATRAVFEQAGLSGDVAVWRDILVEGPVAATEAVVPLLEVRRTFLAERLAIDPEAYARGAHEQAAALEAARHHDEVVLWFEQDLFCAVNLWRVLDWFAHHPSAARLSLVYPTTDEVRGLGALTPATLAELFAQRAPVTAATLALACRAWGAYASPDPLQAAALGHADEAALPFVPGALRCHLGRFPSVHNGLNEVEAATLEALGRGPRVFGELFREVTAHPRVRRHGMGDVQFAAVVRALAPLVRTVDGDQVGRAELHIGDRARDVLAGTVDWLALRPADAWLGGVRVVGGRTPWRWDGPHGRLVVL